MEYQSKCSLEKHSSEDWGSVMPDGLTMEISHHPLTMKHVVNLVIAMERFKGSRLESAMSSEFSDESVLNMMLENFVEEHLILEVASAPPTQDFTRRDELQYNVSDCKKKSWVMMENSMELHAVQLQGGTSHRSVQVYMANYLRHPAQTEGRPVALSIKDTSDSKFYLSCSEEGGKPTLHLEKVENEADMSRISKDSEMVRFLFYRQDMGLDISTFRSASFPEWYISTATDNNLPVDMCLQSADRCRNFTVQNAS